MLDVAGPVQHVTPTATLGLILAIPMLAAVHATFTVWRRSRRPTSGADVPAIGMVAAPDAVLIRPGGESPAVEKRRFEARVPVGAIEPGPVGRALNEAANTVAGEVAAWIGSG